MTFYHPWNPHEKRHLEKCPGYCFHTTVTSKKYHKIYYLNFSDTNYGRKKVIEVLMT